jgi:DNA-binding XRE family transcriptional regulator
MCIALSTTKARGLTVMAKKFAELRASMPVESQQRAAELTKVMMQEMPLQELRQARGLSQKVMAELLHVQQPAIAKLEKRTDMYLSTLCSHTNLQK